MEEEREFQMRTVGVKHSYRKSGFNSNSTGIHQAFSVLVKVLNYALVINSTVSLFMAQYL